MSVLPTKTREALGQGEALLSFRDVRIGMRHRGHSSEIVRGVDLDVSPGEKLGIVGESGSGKTLTVLSVLRLLPDPPIRLLGGTISFAGQDLGSLDEKALEKVRGAEIAMVYQDPMTSLNPLLRVRTQIVETLRAHGFEREAATRDVAKPSSRSVCPTHRESSVPSRMSCPGECCSGS